MTPAQLRDLAKAGKSVRWDKSGKVEVLRLDLTRRGGVIFAGPAGGPEHVIRSKPEGFVYFCVEAT